MIGSILAAIFFRICRPEDFESTAGGLSAKLTSEFLGTYILVLTVGLNVLGESKAGAFSIAAALMCMIFALGSVSGAHFNPAVTLAIAYSGRDLISSRDALLYACAQVCGGTLAAFTYMQMMEGHTVSLSPKD